MTLTELERIEALHARGAESIIGIHNAFPAMAKALREALAALEWQAAMTKALSESQERLAQEVKEARSEVERLRSAISRFVAQYPWQDGPEIQELKALKDGE